VGTIYLGDDPETRAPFAPRLERHALTIAGSGAGKGACQIIPNLLRWPDSVLVVDPKGEAAEATAAFRADHFGQKVAVLDPFHYAAGVEQFRVTFNPLDLAHTVDDLHVLADGLVMRTPHDSQPHWNDSAAEVLAGMLAHLRASDPIARTIASVRPLLRLLTDAKTRAGQLEKMAGTKDAGGLAGDVAARLSRSSNEVSAILSTIQTQTRWLSSPEMVGALTATKGLDLHDLKRGRLSLYLVLPPDKLDLHGRFLRLFVRAALSVMQAKMEDGAHKGTPCLFILDEFYSLGRIGEIQKAAGLMRAYGLHLWPFLQDLGQLEELYGRHGAQTFMGNADAVCCFGIGDAHTAATVSGWLGQVTPQEVRGDALRAARDFEQSAAFGDLVRKGAGADRAFSVEEALIFQRIGRPRLAPDAVMAKVAKDDAGAVARRMLVFRSGRARELVPVPFFAARPAS
jgi:type IV secretion system protein VirD4